MTSSDRRLTGEQQEQIKRSSWRQLNESPLMNRFKRADDAALQALFIGYWPFVDRFPQVIRSTYEATERFARHGRVLSGALREMETDERNHRALWLRSAQAAGITEQALQAARALPEVEHITDAMVARPSLWQRLLDFVAVEIVAEGISASFLSSQAFCDRLGPKGLAWFKVHVVHPVDQTTHEELAYRAALSLMPEDLPSDRLARIDQTVQETVQRFIAAAGASLRAHAVQPV